MHRLCSSGFQGSLIQLWDNTRGFKEIEFGRPWKTTILWWADIRLRDRLVKIITDYRTETSLRHGCNDILKADCVNLLVKYYNEAKRAVCLSNEEDDARSKRDSSGTTTPSVRNMDVKSKTRGGGRCCMCFDPFSIQNVSVVVFFCCHAYHTTCLMDSTDTNTSSKKDTRAASEGLYEYEEDDDNGSEGGDPRMQCILCTTAAN
ncbi:hypothetical protein V6N13_094594 [Hibiscus sabdariffa]|uniref:Vps41 C-terminal RING finger domain-containing protein n=1 Tax=Hibiscus sabdariffa TaxID=183260 RepID=A0ABR2PP81_9ROSI